MIDEPKICAGNIGTVITIEGLFQDDNIRLDSVKNYNEEYKKVLELVAKCAFHYYGKILFTLRKSTIPVADIKTVIYINEEDVMLKKKEFAKLLFGIENIEQLEIIETSCLDLLFKCKGIISHPNYNRKQTKSIIFINDRLVECKILKESIENIYKNISPKPIRPFIYIDLKLSSTTIDVNCHPTKKDVIFLNQTEIIGKIVNYISNRLNEFSSHNLIESSCSSVLSSADCQSSRPAKWFPKVSQVQFNNSMKENVPQISVIPYMINKSDLNPYNFDKETKKCLLTGIL